MEKLLEFKLQESKKIKFISKLFDVSENRAEEIGIETIAIIKKVRKDITTLGELVNAILSTAKTENEFLYLMFMVGEYIESKKLMGS